MRNNHSGPDNNHIEPEEQARPLAATPAWLLTFTDLTALLLAFFVLLLSMSEIKVETWEAITQSLTRELNPAKWKAVETGGGCGGNFCFPCGQSGLLRSPDDGENP